MQLSQQFVNVQNETDVFEEEFDDSLMLNHNGVLWVFLKKEDYATCN